MQIILKQTVDNLGVGGAVEKFRDDLPKGVVGGFIAMLVCVITTWQPDSTKPRAMRRLSVRSGKTWRLDTKTKETWRFQNYYGRAGFQKKTLHALANPALSSRLAGISDLLLEAAWQAQTD